MNAEQQAAPYVTNRFAGTPPRPIAPQKTGAIDACHCLPRKARPADVRRAVRSSASLPAIGTPLIVFGRLHPQ
jgi:hypothetical protein